MARHMIDMYQCPCLLELGPQINELNLRPVGGGSPPALQVRSNTHFLRETA